MQQYRFQDKIATDQSGHRTNNDQRRLAPQFAQKTYATHICLRGRHRDLYHFNLKYTSQYIGISSCSSSILLDVVHQVTKQKK